MRDTHSEPGNMPGTRNTRVTVIGRPESAGHSRRGTVDTLRYDPLTVAAARVPADMAAVSAGLHDRCRSAVMIDLSGLVTPAGARPCLGDGFLSDEGAGGSSGQRIHVADCRAGPRPGGADSGWGMPCRGAPAPLRRALRKARSG